MVFKKGHKINLGRKHSKEYCENLSKKRKGIKLSEETKRKMSEANRGRILSISQKRSISESLKGKKYPKELYPNKGTRNKKWGNHTQESKIKISAHQQGIKVEEWKRFKLSKNRFLKNTAKYQIWRNVVFLRDNFICKNPNCEFCENQQGVYLQAHHIKPLSLFPELVFDVNNGITYCRDFHLKSGMHRKMRLGAQNL